MGFRVVPAAYGVIIRVGAGIRSRVFRFIYEFSALFGKDYHTDIKKEQIKRKYAGTERLS